MRKNETGLSKNRPTPDPSPAHNHSTDPTGWRCKRCELKSVLELRADATNANIFPDSDVAGQVTLDVHDLPLEKMMQAMLEANDLTWSEDGGLIRVRAVESRNFVVDYLRLI